MLHASFCSGEELLLHVFRRMATTCFVMNEFHVFLAFSSSDSTRHGRSVGRVG